MRVFKYMENNNEMRDVAFGRLDCQADDDVPQKVIENISNVVELDAVPKKLSDYSEAEIESFSRFVLYSDIKKIRLIFIVTFLNWPDKEITQFWAIKNIIHINIHCLSVPDQRAHCKSQN